MNPGRKPVTNRVLSRRFTAATPAEKVEFLSSRLERMIKGLQFFAGYCDLAPSEFRSEVKQFVDLAEIELREGLRALQSGKRGDSFPPDSAVEEALQPTLAATVPAPTAEEETAPTLVDTSSDPLLSNPNANLNSLGVSFDSMAQMAEVPEANDLEAILARLQSYGEALDTGDVEGRKVGTQPGRDAREMLLGFEVCRMDSDQAEPPAQPNAESQPSESSGAWSQPHTFCASNEATSLTTQFTGVVQVAPESNAANGLESGRSPTDDLANFDSEGHSSELVPGADQSSSPTQDKSDADQSKSETGSERQSNPTTARESKSDQSENASPVNSIRPDNLLEINALKEELNSMLSQFKSPGAVSSDS
ncbi:MAG: hypothetical protein ACKO81_08015 [Planctomycetota bacterium]